MRLAIYNQSTENGKNDISVNIQNVKGSPGSPRLSYRLAKHNKKSKTSCIPKEVKGKL